LGRLALGEHDRAHPEIRAGQRREQQILATRAGPQRAVKVEHAVGISAGDFGDAAAQRILRDAPFPHFVVIGEEKAAFLARAADQQRDVASNLRRRRVERLLRQIGPVYGRPDIVAIEQRQSRTADRARGWRDCRRQPIGWNLVQTLAIAMCDAECVHHGFGQGIGALVRAHPDRGAALDHGAVE